MLKFQKKLKSKLFQSDLKKLVYCKSQPKTFQRSLSLPIDQDPRKDHLTCNSKPVTRMQAYNVNNNLCGRFNTTQLDRDLVVPKEKSTVWLATTSAIISFLSLGNHTADAQIKGEPVGVVQTDQKNLPQDITERQTITESEISGVVYEKNGPIPGANIIIKGTQNGIATDINGEFKIIAKEGDVLICSFIGFKDENIVINKSKYYNINMSNNVAVLGGEIIVIKKRNFVGRAFHKIGNLFR
jgi:hypothetical protein